MIPLPPDETMCLAHPPGHTDMRKSPATWCEKYRTCARHQSISLAPFNGTHHVVRRYCAPGQFDAYIAVDRSSDGDVA